MNLVWNLSELFKNEEEFLNAIDLLKKEVLEFQKNNNCDLSQDSLLYLLDEKWKLKEQANNILVFASLNYYKDIKSEKWQEYKKLAEGLNEEVNHNLNFVDLKIIALGKDKIISFIKQNKNLEKYRLYLDNIFRKQSHVLSSEDSLKVSEYNKLINEQLTIYNDLINSIDYGKVEIDGEEVQITVSNYSKYLSSKNREIRKLTYETVYQSFLKYQEQFSNILSKIISYRLEISRIKGYNSSLEATLFEENIDSKVIDNLIKVVNNNLPLINRFIKLKMDYLQISDPHVYDLNLSITKDLNINYSLEEAISIIHESLKPLGEEYLKVVDLLLDGHIDASPDDKKHQSITFSWHTYSFINFRGKYLHLKNLIHEIGHIVNYYLSKQTQPYLYEDSTVFVGETASIINEILLNHYLQNNAKTDEEKIFYLTKEIENYLNLIFNQTLYTELEKEYYETESLSVENFNQKYEEIIKKYYGNVINYDDLGTNEWIRLGHLFRWQFYSYKYATGLIIASTVVSLLESNKLTKEEYLEFLKAGSSRYSLDLLKSLKIDLTSDILNDGFKVLEEDIDKLEKILVLRR